MFKWNVLYFGLFQIISCQSIISRNASILFLTGRLACGITLIASGKVLPASVGGQENTLTDIRKMETTRNGYSGGCFQCLTLQMLLAISLPEWKAFSVCRRNPEQPLCMPKNFSTSFLFEILTKILGWVFGNFLGSRLH